MIEANVQGLVQYPGIGMSLFGRTSPEYGSQNLFRVIWAPSRKVTLVFRGETRTIPVYGLGMNGTPQSMQELDAKMSKDSKPGECWILEIWKPCWDLTRLTETEWNADPSMVAQGPYPKNGDYVLSEPFYGNIPTLESTEKLILLVRDGFMRKRPIENAIAIRDRVEKKEEANRNARIDIIHNSSLIGAGEAFSAPGRGHGRGTKTILGNLTTADVGMSDYTAPGSTFAGPWKSRKIRVR